MPNDPPNLGPVPSPLPSFWIAEPLPLDNYRSTPELPPSADIVIIGSGISGASTAYHIIKDNPSPPSVIMLEARNVCSGATGRNGGHLKPDLYSNFPKYSRLYGPEAAAEIAEFEASHIYAAKELIEMEGLECDFQLTRAMDVYLDEKHAGQVEEAYRALRKEGFANLRDVAFVPKKDVERASMNST